MLKIIFAAAGTGGHLFSAHKLATILEEKGCQITFVGKGLKNNSFFLKERFSSFSIKGAPIVKNLSLFKNLFLLGIGFFQSLYFLLTRRVDCIVGFGSYHTFPFLLAAKLLRKKIILFEANCLVGKVNRIIASNKIALACQLPLTIMPKGKKIIDVSSYPFDKPLKNKIVKKEKPTLFIFGGSQGAKVFNELLPFVVKNLEGKELFFEVVHVTGDKESHKWVEEAYRNQGIEAEVLSFCRDMPAFYKKADLIISRAGALTIAELIHYQKPAILIPFPFAKDDHQKINAEFFEKIGGGKLILQKDLSKDTLSYQIEKLLETKKYRQLLIDLTKYQKKEKKEFSTLILDLCKKTTIY